MLLKSVISMCFLEKKNVFGQILKNLFETSKKHHLKKTLRVFFEKYLGLVFKEKHFNFF